MSASARVLTSVVVVLAATLGLVLSRPDPLVSIDQEQPRLNQAAPVPRGAATVRQTFVAAHPGLSAVELLAVVYADNPPAASLTLRLLDAAGNQVAASTFSDLAHNAPLRLSFVPQPRSAGQAYTLLLEGSPDNNATVWAYNLDGYAQGELLAEGTPTLGDAPTPLDLRFSTFYTYLWADALREALMGLARVALFAPLLWLILFAPGLLLLAALLPHKVFSGWMRWGVALGLSLSALPLAWLWISVIGLRWSALTLGAVYVLVGLAVIARSAIRFRVANFRSQSAEFFQPATRSGNGLMILILLVSLAARLLAARDLAFPPWVDSSHHYLIARLLAETGRVPTDYLPLLPVDRFNYHFGLHSLAVTFYWLTGEAVLSLKDVFLFIGQILNGLMPLAAYTFVAGLLGRPRAGLAAAFLVGLISLFPGYYLSWGRYTQLAGLLIFAPALVLLWRILTNSVTDPADASRDPKSLLPRYLTALGLLTAGLLLTHYRVVAFFAIFALVALAAAERSGRKWALGAAVLGAALALPWLVRLVAQAALPLLAAPRVLAASSGYNAFPVEYFRSGLERGWLAAALLSMGWGLLKRERAIWVTAGWVALSFALLNIGPGTWLVNNNAWAITLFLPGALAVGWGVDEWLRLAARLMEAPGVYPMEMLSAEGAQHDMDEMAPGKRAARAFGLSMIALVAGLGAYAGWRGLFAQVNVQNLATVLALPADLPALEWVEQHAPPDAVFLINGWLWQAGAWAGSDGGAWVWPLTHRKTTLPPLDYTY
ncbi:MAG: hypothetical protein ACRDH2_06400, partial [Anaerolineales bacterium]